MSVIDLFSPIKERKKRKRKHSTPFLPSFWCKTSGLLLLYFATNEYNLFFFVMKEFAMEIAVH